VALVRKAADVIKRKSGFVILRNKENKWSYSN
jgi:hypothetical protein